MYFPDIGSQPDCRYCDKGSCPNREKFQRGRRDFSVTSGRCPRLPDDRGFVDPDESCDYANTFDLVNAERSGEKIIVRLSRPFGLNRTVYRLHGYWWFRDRIDGQPVRRVVHFAARDVDDLREQMDYMRTNKMVFRARVEDYCI